MAPTKPSSKPTAASAGPTSARSYRPNRPGPSPFFAYAVRCKREEYDAETETDTSITSSDAKPAASSSVPSSSVSSVAGIAARENDFSEKSWWMVDIDVDEDDDNSTTTQGATAIVKRCMRVHGWDLAKTRKILKAYKQFLTLKKKLKDWDAISLSPCHLVDEMWHQHILDNVNYYHDMIMLCGRFVGHNPGGASDMQGKIERDRFTRECLRENFGGYDATIWDSAGEIDTDDNVQSNKDDTEIITIKVKGRDGSVAQYRINRSSSLYASLNIFDRRFLLDGAAVWGGRTPKELDMKEGDQIDVVFQRPPANDEIIIVVKDWSGGKSVFKIKTSQHMESVFNSFAAENAVHADTLRFSLDGEDVEGTSTPATLGLHGIHAHVIAATLVGGDVKQEHQNRRIAANGGHFPGDDDDPNYNDPIEITIKDQTGEETMFKIKRSTQLKKVFEAYAKIKGVKAIALRFMGDTSGERIDPDETPSSLGLEENDQICCVLSQVGC